MTTPKHKFVTRVIQVAFHRNGIGGYGFHAVLFDTTNEECPTCGKPWGWTDGLGVTSCENRHAGPPVKKAARMLGVVFDEPGHVSVFDVDKLVDPAIGVAFGDGTDGNSWRGDRFESELRAAIKRTPSDGSVRLGPFGLPTKRKAGRRIGSGGKAL